VPIFNSEGHLRSVLELVAELGLRNAVHIIIDGRPQNMSAVRDSDSRHFSGLNGSISNIITAGGDPAGISTAEQQICVYASRCIASHFTARAGGRPCVYWYMDVPTFDAVVSAHDAISEQMRT